MLGRRNGLRRSLRVIVMGLRGGVVSYLRSVFEGLHEELVCTTLRTKVLSMLALYNEVI